MTPGTFSSTRPGHGLNPARATRARVYDALMGQADNYRIDREVARMVRDTLPERPPGEAHHLVQSGLEFQKRSANFLATSMRLDQFILVGQEMQFGDLRQDVIKRMNPDAQIVIVEDDPLMIAHAHSTFSSVANTHVTAVDMFDPPAVVAKIDADNHLDLARPVGLLIGTLSHLPEVSTAVSPTDVMAGYINELPDGSFVTLHHFHVPDDPELRALARKVETAFRHSPLGSGTFATTQEIEAMFCGLPLAPQNAQPHQPGGVVLCDRWFPEYPPGTYVSGQFVAGGLAVKAATWGSQGAVHR